RSGRVLLRIEDHDRLRSRREFEEAILEDLDWLGFEPDEPMVRQSDRSAIYEGALERLRKRGLVYACSCTRSDVARAFQVRAAAELRYPGTCRERGLTESPGLGLRVRLEPSVERFVDLRLGSQEQRPSEQCGDLLVRDREGHWTYQFAATVDDLMQGVTLVIRGVDLLDSTGRQIQLARLLGRADPPAFFHHPLIMKSSAFAKGVGGTGPPSAEGFGAPRQKLSKSDGDTGIRELRARGWTPEQVIDAALAAVR
ncbi:MAG TPA: glutamate--tRNA ligase family protein, partial [Vicinamibacterales bacterium]|nr:glutamate--tRNA ligase family protein [Vicinamibacterales bacterium]